MWLSALTVVALASATPTAAQSGHDPIADAIARVRPSAQEDAWRLVPWQTSLAAALAEARARDRPVFLFGYDGTLDDGNC